MSEREGEVKTARVGQRGGRKGRRPSFFLWKIRGCVQEHLDGLKKLKRVM